MADDVNEEEVKAPFKVLDGYRYQAAFQAVTYPIVRYRPHLDTPIKAVHRLRRSWNHRLKELVKLGVDEKWADQLARCGDFGTTNTFSRYCRQQLLCPYCYARAYVINAYDRLNAYLFQPGKNLCRRDVHLLAFEATELYQWCDLETFLGAIQSTIAIIHHKGAIRNQECHADVPSRGDMVFHRLDCIKNKDTRYVRLRRSGLIVCQSEIGPPKDTLCRWWILPVDTRKELVNAVALVTKIPHHWWKQHLNTYVCLELIRGIKMLTFHGCLRSSYRI